jgi:REP element-mobilizing transposase RayT
MQYHNRHLPHWESVGQPLFVTFSLHGSIPANRAFPPAMTSGEAFVAMDRLLDDARTGPLYLKRPEIAQLVVKALRDGQDRFRRYDLHAFVVMANHVHMLATPHVTARDWLGPLKGYTAHEANKILHRAGPFWQNESYDHLVRNVEEFEKIRRYIEMNPVLAGLVATPAEFPWSSAAPGGGHAAPGRSQAAG